VRTVCDFINAEIGALYQLFEGSGIAQELFIPLIVEYYKAIVQLHVLDGSIKYLESLEQDAFINPEEKNQITQNKKELKADKKALEKLLLEQYQTLKKNLFSQIKEGAVIILETINDDELSQMIQANAGALFYNRVNVPVMFPQSIVDINRRIGEKVNEAVTSMRKDGIVIDEELFAHLVSFAQFYYSYKIGRKNNLKLYYMKEILTDETFEEIFCQNLFTLMEKMGWRATFNYKESPLYEKIRDDYFDKPVFDDLVCDNIFEKNIRDRKNSFMEFSPDELMEADETVDLSDLNYEDQYTKYPEDYEPIDSPLIEDEMSEGGRKKIKAKNRTKRKTRKNNKTRKYKIKI
jgi:hypothetical protein